MAEGVQLVGDLECLATSADAAEGEFRKPYRTVGSCSLHWAPVGEALHELLLAADAADVGAVADAVAGRHRGR